LTEPFEPWTFTKKVVSEVLASAPGDEVGVRGQRALPAAGDIPKHGRAGTPNWAFAQLGVPIRLPSGGWRSCVGDVPHAFLLRRRSIHTGDTGIGRAPVSMPPFTSDHL
jgi:hypothetical protein